MSYGYVLYTDSCDYLEGLIYSRGLIDEEVLTLTGWGSVKYGEPAFIREMPESELTDLLSLARLLGTNG